MCAGRYLLSNFLAYMQPHIYWIKILLMCISTIIELLFCWCADLLLLIYVFAYVQFYFYWDLFLLMCKGKVIEKILCFCAIRVLLSSSTAHVQSRFYWISRLLRCNHLLTCRKTLIDTISCLGSTRWLFNISYCLCARAILLKIFLACVQWPTYWLSWLLVCR